MCSAACVISGFCCDVDVRCALLGYYAASSAMYTFSSFLKELLRNQKVQIEGNSFTSLGHEMFMLPHGPTCENADIVIEQPSRLLSIHIHPRKH